MQIKKFEAVNMEEALNMVKMDLGSDAVILSTKQVKKGGGAFGLFGRSLVEVTAANDYDAAVKADKQAKKVDKSSNISLEEAIEKSFTKVSAKAGGDKVGESTKALWGMLKDGFDDIKSEMLSFKQLYGAQHKNELFQVKNQISELKTIIGQLLVKNKSDESVETEAPLCGLLVELKKQLLDNSVSEFFSNRMITFMNQKIDKQYMNNPEHLRSYLLNLVIKHVKIAGELPLRSEGKKAVMFVGATGVGKTTTIAKLAAEYSINRKLKVALVTLDTYRIAAVEQLRIYANILKIPVYVAASALELGSVLKKTSHFDLVLIDTAGRNYSNGDQVDELKEYFEAGLNLETHLVLSANCKDKDLFNIVNRFKSVPVNKILFTKLDETLAYGSIFNMMIHSGKPLSYLTMGQKVPEDIELASAEKVAKLVVGVN